MNFRINTSFARRIELAKEPAYSILRFCHKGALRFYDIVDVVIGAEMSL